MWFWMVIGAFIVFELILTDSERYGAATFVFLTFASIMIFGNDAIFAFLASNPLWVLGILIGYLVIGVVFSIYKWFSYVRDCLNKSKEARMHFLHNNGIKDAGLDTPVPDGLKDLWSGLRKPTELEWYPYNYANDRTKPPKAFSHKSSIIGWMSYWPFFLVASLIRDPFVFMYKYCSTLFDRISSSVYNKEPDFN